MHIKKSGARNTRNRIRQKKRLDDESEDLVLGISSEKVHYYCLQGTIGGISGVPHVDSGQSDWIKALRQEG